jgi:drug/metabolite transporter, DME family
MIGELAALGAAISWAIAPLLYRKALTNTNPISANIVRCLTNGFVLVVLLFSLGKAGVLLSLPAWALILTVISGIIGLGVGDTLYMVGLKSIGVARTVPLASTYPLFSLIWVVFLLDQSLSSLSIIGAVSILIGIWLLSKQKSNNLKSDPKNKAMLIGIMASLVTAIVWSISLALMDIVVSESAAIGLDANYALVTLRIAAVALFSLALAGFVDKERGFAKISRKGVLLLCIGGLVANGLGWVLMNYSFLIIPQTQAVPISSTSPLFAALAGLLFFQENLTTRVVVGVLAIVAGSVLVFLV